MPRVTIKTGIFTPDGREEELTEFLCDSPGCPNIATHVLGYITELRLAAFVCREHTPRTGGAANRPTRDSSSQ
jgi:hypothetical protein